MSQKNEDHQLNFLLPGKICVCLILFLVTSLTSFNSFNFYFRIKPSNSRIIMARWKNLPDAVFSDIMMIIGLRQDTSYFTRQK